MTAINQEGQIHFALPDTATPPSSRAPHLVMSGRFHKKGDLHAHMHTGRLFVQML
jgi:hypothetical protein